MAEKESHVCVLNAPERIYLMTGCYLHEVGEPVEFDGIDHEGLCWNTAPDDSCEPAYVRSDIFAKVCAERDRLRQKLFGGRQVEGSNHSTACSIWGDDGQGHAEGFDVTLPCNCGALVNWGKEQRLKVESERNALQTEVDRMKPVVERAIAYTSDPRDSAMVQQSRFWQAVDEYKKHSGF